MKIKRISALLLAIALVLTFCACGGPKEPEVQLVDFNLDYESTEWQPMSDDRATEEKLLEVYAIISAGVTETDYADVVALVGCEASEFRNDGSGNRVYKWRTAESEYVDMGLTFELQGADWYVTWFSKTNM